MTNPNLSQAQFFSDAGFTEDERDALFSDAEVLTADANDAHNAWEQNGPERGESSEDYTYRGHVLEDRVGRAKDLENKRYGIQPL